MSFDHDLFISYSRTDREWALQLRADLERRGLNVFLDTNDIVAGAPWEERVRTAAEQSRHVLALWSPAARKSSWVSRELAYFDLRTNALPAGSARIEQLMIFVLLDADNPPYPSHQMITDLKGTYAAGFAKRDPAVWDRVVNAVVNAVTAGDKRTPVTLAVTAIPEHRVAGAQRALDLLEKRVKEFKAWCHQAAHGAPPAQQPSEISSGEVETIEQLVREIARDITGSDAMSESLWEPSRPFCRKIERPVGEYWAQQDEYFRCFLLWIDKTRMYLTSLDRQAPQRKTPMFDPWYMAGTEKTGKYVVVLRTRLGRVGYRELDRGSSYRVRVEPETLTRDQLAKQLTWPQWKQPGDQGQNRFSAEVREAEFAGVLAFAIRALDPKAVGAQVNPVAPDWAQNIVEQERHAKSRSGPKRNQVFFSYSHKDRKWLEQFQAMLKPAMLSDMLWDDTKIDPGAKWKDEIRIALAAAKVAVLLVSKYFLASDFISRHELLPLLKAEKEEGLTILWVPVGSSLVEETEIAEYQAAHDPSRPLDTLKGPKRDKALVEICKKIKAAIKQS
jgi:hypothetical protein